jgi:mannose-6-phosphate isomerase-like protein (cupin superfamily)
MTTRRDLMISLPALAMLGDAFTMSAQTSGTANELDHSTVFSIEHLPVKKTDLGSFQHVVSGKLPTGERIEIHNTTLNPGAMPHPPHRHTHTEFMMIREGSLSWMLGEVTIAAGPGDILYARSGELHGLKNVGSTVARYAVIAIGNDAG